MNIDEVLTRGISEILPSRKEFKDLIESKKIKIYQGFDPTSPDLHIGHAVALRKLRQFQLLGHKVIFLIGDFTATIGDPSGKTNARKLLTKEEVLKNAQNYKKQASKILDFDGKNAAEIRYNSEWLSKLSALDFFKLAQNLTYQQVIERDMFQKRQEEGNDIYLNEFLYPFMQGYDSIALDVDAEIGGSDQLFNMLMGRKLMRNVVKKDKFVLTVPLLTDSSGKKLGKSEGNAIALDNDPENFYGQIMSLGDDSIVACFELLTDLPIQDISDIKDSLKNGNNPLKFKKQLAYELTRQFNNKDDAEKAALAFEKTFQKKDPEYSQTIPLKANLAATIAPFTTLQSTSEAKRLISQGAIKINGESVKDLSFKLEPGQKVQIGTRFFGTIVK